MKYKLRRFMGILALAVIFSYAGSKSITIVYALLGGLAVGYLFHWEDRNWIHKDERRY